ncbi:PPOX class F420-dependent oxidoreductase [Planotetraspora kaengkrachanensis]|uniref:PPOX class F420-dependent oxidoreductase n=1 Tax=Planotetraspora kaengkrachanensis TaxID=575193 RepID=A0A8J3V907_9ACTN|nr:PPOX class F420-dependent oxidoreductase [Planotetraspora kaengkrachanensis]GIG83065.1 PPOX class F420-dependent oxidoreductase [Planotetraspora kaengkrachanensis]
MTWLNETIRGRHISLTTFRGNGRPVPTPVGFVVDGDELFVLTARDSGKIKRLRNNTSVVVSPCDGRGRIAEGAPSTRGTARLLDETETARVRRLMSRRYPAARLVFWWNRFRGDRDRWVGIEVTP